MVEPEIAFADLTDNANLAEQLLKYIFAAVLKENPDDMDFFQQRVQKDAISRLEQMITADFVRMDYTEAVGHP